jgi:hypothetical protein
MALWTQTNPLVAPRVHVPRGIYTTQLDLTQKTSALLVAFACQLGTTAPTVDTNGVNGIKFTLYREAGGGAASFGSAVILPFGIPRVGAVTQIHRSTLNGAPSGQTYTLTSATGFTPESIVCLTGQTTDPDTLADGTALTGLELAIVSRINSATLTLQQTPKQSHVNAEYVTDTVVVWTEFLDGGWMWDINWDTDDLSAGSRYAIGAYVAMQG